MLETLQPTRPAMQNICGVHGGNTLLQHMQHSWHLDAAAMPVQAAVSSTYAASQTLSAKRALRDSH